MPTTKEWICPDETYKDLLSKISSSPGSNNVPSNQGTINNSIAQAPEKPLHPTRIIHTATNIPIQTSKEVITVVGQNEIVSLVLIVKNPILSLQSVKMTIRIDDSNIKDTLLNIYMFMQNGAGLRARYFEEVTNVNMDISTTLHDSGSILYLYMSEPLIIKSYFGITINNTYTSTFNSTLETKTLLLIKGV